MTTVRRALVAAVLMVLAVVALPGLASASSACPRCAGHGDKVGGDYVVRAGDTLSDIAAAHRVSVATLYAQNQDVLTDPDRIYTGQRLLVGASFGRVLPQTYRLTIAVRGTTVGTLEIAQPRGLVVTVTQGYAGHLRLSSSRTRSSYLMVANETGVTITVTLTRSGTTLDRISIVPNGVLHFSPPNRVG